MLFTERPHIVKNAQYFFLSLQIKMTSVFFPLPIFAMLPLFWLCLSKMFDDSPKLGFLWELLSQLKDEVTGEAKFDGW